MTENFKEIDNISRRGFIKGVATTTVAGLAALALSRSERSSRSEKQNEVSQRYEPLSALYDLRKEAEKDPSLAYVLSKLFPLFPPVLLPCEQEVFSSVASQGRTVSDFYGPSELKDKPLEVQLLERLKGTTEERQTPLKTTTIFLENQPVQVLELFSGDGPCEIGFFQLVQGHPHEFPEGPEGLEIIIVSDGDLKRYDAKDFFKMFSPLSATAKEAGGNVATPPIFAREKLAVYLREKETIAREERKLFPFMGWFNLMISKVKPQDKSFIPTGGIPKNETFAFLEHLKDELPKCSDFASLPSEIYGSESLIKTARVNLKESFSLTIEKGRTSVGLEITLDPKFLPEFGRALCTLVYSSGEKITLPLAALLGCLKDDPSEILPTETSSYLNGYQSLYSGIRFKEGKINFYANYPLSGVKEIKITAKKNLEVSFRQTLIENSNLPQFFKDHKFFPYYNDQTFAAADFLLVPRTTDSGFLTTLFLEFADWRRKRGSGVFEANPDWRQFYLEYNPSLYRFKPDEDGFYRLSSSREFTGLEDLFSSFYNPQTLIDPVSGKPENLKKGTPLLGGFTSHQYLPEFDEIVSGIWVNLPFSTKDQCLFLPEFGHFISDKSRIKSLAVCYLPQKAESQLNLEAASKLLEVDLSKIPLISKEDYLVRLNLERLQQVLKKSKLNPEQLEYLEKAGSFYRLIDELLKSEQSGSDSQPLSASFFDGLKLYYEMLFKNKDIELRTKLPSREPFFLGGMWMRSGLITEWLENFICGQDFLPTSLFEAKISYLKLILLEDFTRVFEEKISSSTVPKDERYLLKEKAIAASEAFIEQVLPEIKQVSLENRQLFFEIFLGCLSMNLSVTGYGGEAPFLEKNDFLKLYNPIKEIIDFAKQFPNFIEMLNNLQNEDLSEIFQNQEKQQGFVKNLEILQVLVEKYIPEPQRDIQLLSIEAVKRILREESNFFDFKRLSERQKSLLQELWLERLWPIKRFWGNLGKYKILFCNDFLTIRSDPEHYVDLPSLWLATESLSLKERFDQAQIVIDDLVTLAKCQFPQEFISLNERGLKAWVATLPKVKETFCDRDLQNVIFSVLEIELGLSKINDLEVRFQKKNALSIFRQFIIAIKNLSFLEENRFCPELTAYLKKEIFSGVGLFKYYFEGGKIDDTDRVRKFWRWRRSIDLLTAPFFIEKYLSGNSPPNLTLEQAWALFRLGQFEISSEEEKRQVREAFINLGKDMELFYSKYPWVRKKEEMIFSSLDPLSEDDDDFSHIVLFSLYILTENSNRNYCYLEFAEKELKKEAAK